MADALANIPVVEIDPEGTFKYILLRVKVKGGDAHKDIVRGTKSAEYHSKFRTAEELQSASVSAGEVTEKCPERQIKIGRDLKPRFF